jgi:hypothetical protein
MEVTLWQKYKTISKQIMKEKKDMRTPEAKILSAKLLTSIWDAIWALMFRDNADPSFSVLN